ncbi:hypothetical protein [Microtetraspora niveoalba]|uniref:hypothetical protein n=1 Tax=Microtetraspora niveoalba TaxID=46175 RepID=UPI000833273B|nr:hypothetical protein [Microtetraspora niveoalba]
MKITYPVPAETTSVFVVAAERPPAELDSIVPWRMSGPHRRAAARALGTPRLGMRVFPAAQSPWRRVSLGDEGRDAVRGARHHVVVTATASLAEQPEAAQVARAVARGVADACRGVIVDVLTGGIVPHQSGCQTEPVEFRLEDDWLGWSTEIGSEGSCPPWDPAATDACTCLTVTTRGLRRFGLPEVMLEGAACAHGLCTVSLLRAVAGRLLAGHLAWSAASPEARRRTIGEHLWIGGTTGEGAPVCASGPPDLDHRPSRVSGTPDHDRHVSRGAGIPDHDRHVSQGSGTSDHDGHVSRGAGIPDHDGHVPRDSGIPDLDQRPFCVRLGSRAADGSCLSVGPPIGFTGTLNDWLCRTPGLLAA